MAVNDAGVEQFDNIAVGDLGTQLFHFNTTKATFEYALPVTAGAEFCGDTESFEAPETDLDYVPKIGGRRSINDIAYTINYTKEKYAKAEEITDPVEKHTYMEVLRDGSAMIFEGTCAMPSITAGDVRQISMTIIPSYIQWVSNINELTVAEQGKLNSDWYTANAIKLDKTSIPTARQQYFARK